MQPQLSREDFVIICGDFGLVWQDCAEERRWLNWLEEKPWTTLWVDGNHENFDRLHTYPATEWHGGKIQKIMPHVFHLCRGQIFQLENRRIFTMGGAGSFSPVSSALASSGRISSKICAANGAAVVPP